MRAEIISSFKSDPALLEAIRSAPAKLPAHEIFEQKVSFVFSSIDRKTLTREQVREMIMQQAGEPACTESLSINSGWQKTPVLKKSAWRIFKQPAFSLSPLFAQSQDWRISHSLWR